MIKLFVLVAALLEVQAGRVALETRYPLRARNQVPGNGVLRLLSAGLSLSLGDLLTLMIAASDNSATNKLLEIVGQDAVNAFCARPRFGATQLVGALQLPAERQNPQQQLAAILSALAQSPHTTAPCSQRT